MDEKKTSEATAGALQAQTYDDRFTIPEPTARTYGARGVSYGPSTSATPAYKAVAHGFLSLPHTIPPRDQPNTLREVFVARQPTARTHVSHVMADSPLTSTAGAHNTRHAIHSAPLSSLERPTGGTVGMHV